VSTGAGLDDGFSLVLAALTFLAVALTAGLVAATAAGVTTGTALAATGVATLTAALVLVATAFVAAGFSARGGVLGFLGDVAMMTPGVECD
jgi:hypothetical protein